MAYTYAEVETMLAVAHCYDALRDAHGSFRARLKHLSRLGIPTSRVGLGKGNQKPWSRDELLQAHFALHLERLGYTPAIIAGWMRRRWETIAPLVEMREALLLIQPLRFGAKDPFCVAYVKPTELSRVLFDMPTATVICLSVFLAAIDRPARAEAA